MGVHVFAACLAQASAAKLDRETSARVHTLQMDVTKDADIDRALKHVERLLCNVWISTKVLK